MRVVIDSDVLVSGVFFGCALATDRRLIISGDKHVLAASGYGSIKVATPRDLVDSLGPPSGR